jgi:hypothetical protein
VTQVGYLVLANSTALGGSALPSSPSQKGKIAIVVPTFTETAYSTHAFYTFYNKYGSTPIQKEVKTDLDMLNPPFHMVLA